jgi:hypothetical protein
MLLTLKVKLQFKQQKIKLRKLEKKWKQQELRKKESITPREHLLSKCKRLTKRIKEPRP